MKYNAEPNPYSLPKLRLFSITPHPSEPSTPPFQTSASIPFRWEEQPGKPRKRPSTDRIFSSPNPTTARTTTLDLPPRLVSTSTSTKPVSLVTVTDEDFGDCKSVFESGSFRLITGELLLRGRGWSRGDEESGGGQWQRLLVGGGSGRRRKGGGGRRFRVFGVRGGGKRKGSCVISEGLKSSIDAGFVEEKWREMMRNSSVSNVVTRSHFWAKIYEGFKQVLPWRKKPKVGSYTL